LEGWNLIDSFGYEESLLERDVGIGWDSRNPEYPAYQPIFVLQNCPR
jgi:hypothetical protein